MRPSALALVVALLIAACAGTRDVGEPQILVFAAASLGDAFHALADAHPESGVTLNLAGSQRLAAQLVQGAPGDVFASADRQQMEVVADAGLLAGLPRAFATNRLAIVVAPGNPHDIEAPADLADPALTVVLAGPEVPVGRYSRQALARAGVRVEPASLELDTRAVLRRVALGEADAGIVYASDLHLRDDVEGVLLPAEHNVAATAFVAVLADAPNPQGASAFLDLVLSREGQEVLTEYGFSPP